MLRLKTRLVKSINLHNIILISSRQSFAILYAGLLQVVRLKFMIGTFRLSQKESNA